MELQTELKSFLCLPVILYLFVLIFLSANTSTSTHDLKLLNRKGRTGRGLLHTKQMVSAVEVPSGKGMHGSGMGEVFFYYSIFKQPLTEQFCLSRARFC